MPEEKKPVKFFWTHLPSRKDAKVKDDSIKLKVPPQTHIWRHTEEDGSVNNSPFYFRKVSGDFDCTVKITAKMQTWLDQCGILVQEKRGIYTKCSFEYHEPPKENGILRQYACCYVHPEEWQFERSLNPYPGQFHRGDPKYAYEMLDKGTKIIWLKLSRLEGYIEASYSLDGENWKELKAAKFTDTDSLSVGIFAASPGGSNLGFKCTFEELEITEDDDLSDDASSSAEEDEESVGADEDGEPPPPLPKKKAVSRNRVKEEVAEEEQEIVEEDEHSDEDILNNNRQPLSSGLGALGGLGVPGGISNIMMDSVSEIQIYDDSDDESR